MKDWQVEKATTWEELQAAHGRWMADYNAQDHWAHRKREDGRRSPGEVLDGATGRTSPPGELQRIFRVAGGERRVNRAGYVRFRNWDRYGERGQAHQRVALWLSPDAETLTVAHADEPLAQYAVAREPDHEHLKELRPLCLFDTRFRSPQPLLWEPEALPWRLALPRPTPARRRRHPLNDAVQLSLPSEIAVLLPTYLCRSRCPNV